MLQVSVKGHNQEFEREVEAVAMVTITNDKEKDAWNMGQLILGMMSIEKSTAVIKCLENLITELKRDVVKHSLENLLGKLGKDIVESDAKPCDCEKCSEQVN